MRGPLCWVLDAYTIVILGYFVFSWVPRPPDPVMPLVRGVRALVDPVLSPVRRVLPPVQMGGVALDLSLIAVFLMVSLLRAAVCG